jgi:myo-inositol-1(or 4)-monophosphatase
MTSAFTLSDELMPALREIARDAGAMAMSYFRSGLNTSARIWSKAGGSPVTEADVAVDAFLKVRLSQLLPPAAWLSEETVDDPRRLGKQLVWIVDPIDGTRAFLSGNHDWSVAIALLSENRPVVGIVYAPAHEAFFEARRGAGAFRNETAIEVARSGTLPDVMVAGPVPFVDELENRVGPVKRSPRIPSLALRISRVAEGAIDAAMITTDARDWDIAAAHLILEEAGGTMTGLDRISPAYNQADPKHGALVAAGAPLQRALIDAMTEPRTRTAADRG